MILKNHVYKSDRILNSIEKKDTIMRISEEKGYPRLLMELPNGFGLVKGFYKFTKDRIFINSYNDLASITFFNPPTDISEKLDAVVVKFDLKDINNIFYNIYGLIITKLNFSVTLMSFDMDGVTYISPILKIRLKLLNLAIEKDTDYILELYKNRSSFSFVKKYLGIIHNKDNSDVFKLMITKLK